MRKYLTAVAAILTFLLTPATVAHAAPAVVTEFPFTQAVYNTCNDDLLIVNGTQVDSMRLTQGRDGGMTYKHVVRWKDVRVESQLGITYHVKSGSIDSFTTRIGNGAAVQRSLHASWLTLERVDGGPGDLRLTAVHAYRTDAQGITRTLDRYRTSCS
jgi:hypothetical protein